MSHHFAPFGHLGHASASPLRLGQVPQGGPCSTWVGGSQCHRPRMKPVLLGLLALLLLAQLGVGQQSCPCAGFPCACATSAPNPESSDGTAIFAPGSPPTGSREFLTPTGDSQSPSSAGTPIKPGNAQQSPTWVGAAMISSSDDAVVLVRLEPLHEVALSLSRPYRMLCCTFDVLVCRPARKA